MKLLLKVLLTSIFCSHAALAEQQMSSPSLKTRRITEQAGVPIASRLVPGDEMVLVEPAGYETRFVDTTVLSVAEDLDLRETHSDLIVIAEHVASVGILINNDSYVRSRATFRPVCVVKDAKRVTSESELVTVFHGGGDIRLNGVLVRAGYFYVYKPGERYLLFLRSFSKDNNATFGLPIAVDPDNQLSPMELSTGRTFPASSKLFGLDLEMVIAELTRRLNRPK